MCIRDRLCGFRELMGFIHDDDAVLREDGAFSLAAVDGVCHQQIMIGDLKQKLIFVDTLIEEGDA